MCGICNIVLNCHALFAATRKPATAPVLGAQNTYYTTAFKRLGACPNPHTSIIDTK